MFFLLLLFLNIDVITKIEGIYLNPGLHLTEFVTYEVGLTRTHLAHWLSFSKSECTFRKLIKMKKPFN